MGAGAKPKINTIEAGEELVRQGDAGTDVYMILDGIFVVEVDGDEIAEIGPGAVVGERAALQDGLRTATLAGVHQGSSRQPAARGPRCAVARWSGGDPQPQGVG